MHPRHGIHDPSAGTPSRRPGSVRRTLTVETRYPAGLRGTLAVHGRGRDLVTHADGTVTVAAAGSLEIEVDGFHGRTVTAVRTTPAVPALAGLVGARLSGGFRTRLRELAPDLAGAQPILAALLDDVPIAVLVSGTILLHVARTAALAAGTAPASPASPPTPTEVGLPPGAPSATELARGADQCAGWRHGATIMVEVSRTGRPPAPTGPPAPSLDSPDDPLAWHLGALDPLAPFSSRRHRRIDLTPTETPAEAGTDAELTVDVLFRDSYQPEDEPQTIVHEYEVHGALDAHSTRFTRLAATPRVLPWLECPEAVPSAAWLVGQPAGDARATVRRDFVGPPTCTHLNDTLRHLADLPALASLLPPAGQISS
ncbi:DUF2889 domain-containing protein [Candidatus Frankia nodulisporulans]|uniref:DUF2889 domain-containing protein n=1 Tax=Candidatus Frankia nodulisporulans TaxID=2060052 RepID=UPI001CDB8B97|nr:DUF2889 domain-containing protein [Candidatus Frankia nodulisporulans]